MSSHAPIPVGTRVIVIRTGANSAHMLGKIGVVYTPLGVRECLLGQGVDFGAHGCWFAPIGAVVPLPPEHDVAAHDRRHRDVELVIEARA